MIKRIFDFFFALVCLTLSLPIWAFICLAIYLEDGLPIFYFQERIGKNNKIFTLIKFRSMVKDAEENTGAVLSKEKDTRVTKLGNILRKTAMDELPQLLTILSGDMSFVGPRPERSELVADFSKEFKEYNLRHAVTPGLTGVAQILGSAYLSYRKKFQYDMWYVKNQNFFLDIYLIFLSFVVTFQGKWSKGENKFVYLARNFKNRVEQDIF